MLTDFSHVRPFLNCFMVVSRDIPIVHRVLKVHEKASGRIELLTKVYNLAAFNFHPVPSLNSHHSGSIYSPSHTILAVLYRVHSHRYLQ
jgi:hypothetical protein